MARKYFGTDGVRGRVGVTPITPDFVMKLGYAAGGILTRADGASGKPVVLIGKDTRISGYMLEAALEAGFSAAGVDVMLAGPIPTPAVAYLTRTLRLSAGVVISASHNPYYDNGIKFFSAGGTKLPDCFESDLEAAMDAPMGCVSSERLGKAKRLEDARGRYIEFCKSTFPAELNLRGVKIVVDCAHGAAYQIAPEVLHELGAEVIAIGNTPNGLNINEGCGATEPSVVAAAVQEHGADLGIALDGDADRLIMVDASGRIYDGDELLYILVKDRMTIMPVGGVVGTLMTNMAVELAFKSMDVPFVRAKVGDRYILEMLQERGWMIGGEGSGHLLLLDKHSTGDGMISALQVLAALKRSEKTLAECTADINLCPQAVVNVRIPAGFDWQRSAALLRQKTLAEAEIGDRGRVLIRASGTEPLIRVMVEASTANMAHSLARRIAGEIPA